MKNGKKILMNLTIIFGILITLNSFLALPIYSGDNVTFESNQFDYFTVVGNSTSIDGMNVTWDNGNMTLLFNRMFKSNNFTLVFFNEIGESESSTDSSCSSGSTSVIYKDRNVTEYVYLNNSPETIEKETIKEVTVGGETTNKLPKWAFFTLIILGFITFVSVGFIIYGYFFY